MCRKVVTPARASGIAVLTVLLPFVTAQADESDSQLVGIQYGFEPTPLYSIAPTGDATPRCDTGIPFGTGLTFDSKRRVFYAVDLDALYLIPLGTCTPTFLINLDVRHLTYDPNNDKLYAGSGSIQEIDPSTLEVRSLGNAGIGEMYALAFHPVEGKLYAIGAQGGGGYFVRFNDLENLDDQTFIAQLRDQGVDLVTALAYDSASGNFWGSAANSPFRSLITVDPANGAVTTIGSFNIGGEHIDGLAVTTDETDGSLRATVIGVDAFAAACKNQTDPQAVATPLPGETPAELWDCEALGLTATPGDSVRLVVRAHVPEGAQDFRGTTGRLASPAKVHCINSTQGVEISVPFIRGIWSCTDAGLPMAEGDVVIARIIGTVAI